MSLIVIRYQINGLNMKRTYAREDYKDAKARIAVLAEQGVSVRVTGMPMRLEVK